MVQMKIISFTDRTNASFGGILIISVLLSFLNRMKDETTWELSGTIGRRGSLSEQFVKHFKSIIHIRYKPLETLESSTFLM